ncbi:MAG TPA: HD domain-containing phosphohydrolase [Vicinamibacterales bacterium]|nr:HD domain-containing phosphohydrolase [Vicinamibacterales bacterium]
MTTSQSVSLLDPLAVLRGLASLRRLAGTYPAGHPMIAQKLKELGDLTAGPLSAGGTLRIDVIRGDVYLDGVAASSAEHQANQQLLSQLTNLGINSIHIHAGVELDEFLAVAEFLWQYSGSGDAVASQLSTRNVRHISLGKLVSLDTRWRAHQWPDAPTGPLDPDYAESLLVAQQTFENTAAGKPIDAVTVRDLVQLLIHKVARSNAALGQILAVKQYENLTYCHSVNVAVLSLLLGKHVGLDDATLTTLVEAALLHDVGKTQIPLEIVKKAGALDKHERKLIEAHTTLGAEILVQSEGLHPLTPTVALEHHRGVKGTGYPDLGDAVPHPMSQIVSVADIYEAITGARSYQDPTPPERACLILARLAGDKLNTALVKTFVNAITFFPVGSLVRTNRNELGLVIETRRGEPLHPVLTLVDEQTHQAMGRVDTAARDASGAYERHISQTVPVPDGLDLRPLLDPALAA